MPETLLELLEGAAYSALQAGDLGEAFMCLRLIEAELKSRKEWEAKRAGGEL